MTNKGILSLDDGIYRQAKSEKKHLLQWLSDEVLKEIGKTGKDFAGREVDVRADLKAHVADVLARHGCPDDMSVRAKALRLHAEDTYGLTRELEARGVDPRRDTGEKFFTVTANTPLFPAWMASTFVEARIASGLLSQMVYADIPIDRLTYDKVRFNEAADAREMRNVGIGADLPLTDISQIGTNIKVNKFGRRFRYAREVVALTPLEVIASFIRRVGRQIALDETDEAIYIAHAGDGESGSSITDTIPAVDATCGYPDLVTLENAFNDAYIARLCFCTRDLFATIQNMAEYKDPLARRDTRVVSDLLALPTPSGAGLIYRWTSTKEQTYMYPSGSETGGRILALDNTAALYVVRIGDLLEEMDTIISSGKQEVALSYMMAVVSGDPDAKKSLDVTA